MKTAARLFLLLALLFCLPAEGQEKSGFFRDLNDFLDMRADKKDAKIDTSYVGRYPYRWDARTFTKVSGMHFVSSFGDSELDTGVIPRIGLGISYRGLGLNFSHVIGKRNNYVFMLNMYGNHLGIEYDLHAVTDPKGYVNYPHLEYDDGGISNLLLISNKVNVFYSFNSRFSYAAGMKQNRIQRRSAGSFIAAFSWSVWDMLFLRDGQRRIDSFFEANYFYQRFSLGAGYGLNLVFGQQHWLYHISVIPMWSVYEMQGWRENGQRERTSYPYGFLSFAGTGRTGLYYRWGSRWSIGLNGIFNSMTSVSRFSRKADDYYHFGGYDWQADLSLAFRF